MKKKPMIREKSTLGKMMPPLLFLSSIGAALPLPRPIMNMLPPMLEVVLPSSKVIFAYLKILRQGMKGKKKVILHPFSFPPEILHAMNIAPLFIEFLSTTASFLLPSLNRFFPDNIAKYLDHSYELGLPRSLCAGQLGGGSAIRYGDFPKPDIILNGAPGFCDVNSKIMEYTSRTMNIPMVHIEIPPYRDERGLDYFKSSFRDAISRLEELTGNKLDHDRLRETVENSNKATELYTEITGLQTAVPYPISNFYVIYAPLIRFAMGGRPEAISFFEVVLNSAKRNLRKGKGALPEEKVRSLWAYTSIYFDPMFYLWLEKIGMALLMDLTAWFAFKPIDTSSVDTMIDGLAEQAINFPMARQMKGGMEGPGSWSEDMVFLAKKLKADCVVFSGNAACKRSWGSISLLRKKLKEEMEIPTLMLDTDSWDKRITSISVTKEKIEDFIETII